MIAPAARPTEIRGWEEGAATTGAELEVAGARDFEGPVAFRCVLHDEAGLQVSFRTGDPLLPVVALRVENFRGNGTYPARLFVTTRSQSGSLWTWRGQARTEIRRRNRAGAADVLLAGGTFSGNWGPRAKGSIEGRFGACAYRERQTPAASPVAP